MEYFFIIMAFPHTCYFIIKISRPIGSTLKLPPPSPTSLKFNETHFYIFLGIILHQMQCRKQNQFSFLARFEHPIYQIYFSTLLDDYTLMSKVNINKLFLPLTGKNFFVLINNKKKSIPLYTNNAMAVFAISFRERFYCN